MKLLRKEKKNLFAKLHAKNITDDKTFWQTIKFCFSDKTLDSDRLALINDEIISDDAKTFNEFFSNVAKSLNLKVDEMLQNQNVDLIENPVLRSLKRYENHPSVTGIERNLEGRNFSFMFAFSTGIEQQVKNLRRLLRTGIFQPES